MRITIDTEVLRKEGLSLGDFLVLLMGFHDVNYRECLDRMTDKGLVQTNVFDSMTMVLSNNTRDYIARILMQSSDRVRSSGIDFEGLALKMQALYPEGRKPGTSYDWRCNTREIIQKLMTLVAKYDFSFTEEEALLAVRQYVGSFGENKARMQLLKYFILRTYNRGEDISSQFMTIIENNRDYESNIK